MKTKLLGRLCLLATLAVGLLCGCDTAGAQKGSEDQAKAQPESKKTQVGKNVALEIEGDGEKRRVLVNAVVCLRRGMLEQFLCRKDTKEHESILAADVDAKVIHTALLAAGAEAGSPVQFVPKYKPAHGSVIKVFVQYEEKGKVVKIRGQQWIRNIKTNKELDHDWVFAGSVLFHNKLDAKAPPRYAANDGDVICVSNFDTAMLDLPIASSDIEGDQLFEAFTERIPPEETRVLVILEPAAPAKK